MRILIFDIYGRFAHFRKFYTNSSSLTYSLPPRTTIVGIIASIIGYERDSYYDIFNSKNLQISVRKIGKTKKILQTVNHIRATTMNKLMMPEQHTQVPYEILVGEDNLRYRIYVTHKDKKILSEIIERIKFRKFFYPPCLGAASFLANISYIDTVGYEEIDSTNYLNIATVIRSEEIEDIRIKNYSGKLVKERMPRDFSKGRIIKEVNNYIYDDEGKLIEVKLKEKVLKLNNGEFITKM